MEINKKVVQIMEKQSNTKANLKRIFTDMDITIKGEITEQAEQQVVAFIKEMEDKYKPKELK